MATEKQLAYWKRLKSSMKGKNNSFYRKSHSDETRNHLSEVHKGKPLSEKHRKAIKNSENSGRFKKGHTVPEEWREISRNWHTGKKRPVEWRNAISKGNTGKKRTVEERLKYRESKLGEKNPSYGKVYSDEERTRWSVYSKEAWKNMSLTTKKRRNEKIRVKRAKYIEEVGGPRMGKFEKQILDNLEESLGYDIFRQHRVNGYFLDGYCSALNLAIEVDERYHKKKECLQRDYERENNIKNTLNCSFLRLEV